MKYNIESNEFVPTLSDALGLLGLVIGFAVLLWVA